MACSVVPSEHASVYISIHIAVVCMDLDEFMVNLLNFLLDCLYEHIWENH